ncbi:hypothetical protein Droror1_Dr00025662 [Drosera rotundifolia]
MLRVVGEEQVENDAKIEEKVEWAADDDEQDNDVANVVEEEPPTESDRQGATRKHRFYYSSFERNVWVRMSRFVDRLTRVESLV